MTTESHFARIESVADTAARPLWSVLIPCYNCAGFLAHTLESVLAQDPGPGRMEIIVVDDCSDRDDPEEVVRKLGAGRVRFLRQSVNVGKVRNYETGLHASRGHLIHQLHGDDTVLPGFYRSMESAFGKFPEAGAFFCESEYMDEEGRVTGRTGVELDQTGLLDEWLPKIAAAQRIQTPSMVVRRSVYEAIGGFDRRLDCSEDWEMWIRVASQFPTGFCSEAKARYRTSTGNNSSRSIVKGTRGVIQRQMFMIVDGYLPPAVTDQVRADRNLSQAYFFASNIPSVLSTGGVGGWLKLCREILRFSRRPEVWRRIASLTVRAIAAPEKASPSP